MVYEAKMILWVYIFMASKHTVCMSTAKINRMVSDYLSCCNL